MCRDMENKDITPVPSIPYIRLREPKGLVQHVLFVLRGLGESIEDLTAHIHTHGHSLTQRKHIFLSHSPAA